MMRQNKCDFTIQTIRVIGKCPTFHNQSALLGIIESIGSLGKFSNFFRSMTSQFWDVELEKLTDSLIFQAVEF